VTWAAQRAGLYYTCISSKLSESEIDYIMKDCGAKALITSAGIGPLVDKLPALLPGVKLFMVGPAQAPSRASRRPRQVPATPIADETAGSDMLYSSGTTGVQGHQAGPDRRGHRRAQPAGDAGAGPVRLQADSVYISPAPSITPPPALEHGRPAPGRHGRRDGEVRRRGGARLIEKYKIDVGQFVPTHFVRMLKLPEDVRLKYDVSSMRSRFTQPPLPDPGQGTDDRWWGPVIQEYYAGTEATASATSARRNGWPTRARWASASPPPCGSATRRASRFRPARGQIYFEGGPVLSYHNAPEKVLENTNRHG